MRDDRKKHGHGPKEDSRQQKYPQENQQHLTDRVRQHGERLYQLQHFTGSLHAVNQAKRNEQRQDNKHCRCQDLGHSRRELDQIQFFLSIPAAQQKLIHVIGCFFRIHAGETDSGQKQNEETKGLKGFE